jgi:trehalose 6-phosphate synthase
VSRLVVVSNRVPSLADGNCSGGLAVALSAALEEGGGLWFGWSGTTTAAPKAEAKMTHANGFDLATIDLSDQEFRGFYEQHANRVLWPLFHGRLDLVHLDGDCHDKYRAVNRRFADALLPALGDDDMVWVHDYHLIPLGAELRRRGIGAPLGFFLHIPFPPVGTVAALPWHRQLVQELCAYDVVGFQTRECVENFNDAVGHFLPAASSSGHPGGERAPVHAAHYPIGIDTHAFAALADSENARRWRQRLQACMGDRVWAAGVERLDYTKGLKERFLAFERLFEQSPQLHGRVSLIQIAAPSREGVAEYQKTQSELESLSGRINARFGSFDWTPIKYMNRAFDHTQLAALYRVSRIGVVTSLRDGMNMVAKEYVAAQDPADPGVLVLSRFAGAAEELTDALIVNPHDTDAVAEALRQALEMPLAERRRRWSRMMAHLRRNDVHHWCRSFLDDLQGRGEAARLPAAVA